MNRSSKELKRLARENLTGHYSTPMGAFVCAGAISLAIELPFSMLQNNTQTTTQTVVFALAEFLIGLLSSILIVGQFRVHLSMARKQPYELNQLFYGFKNHPDRIIICSLLVTIFTGLACIPVICGTLLFVLRNGIASGIIFAVTLIISLILCILLQLMFQQIYFLLLDRQDLSSMGCIKESARLMKGHKGRLFYILLSFLGMDILVLLSLGIGSLWIMPYQSQTYTLFYLDITGQLPESSISGSAPQQEQPTFNKYV